MLKRSSTRTNRRASSPGQVLVMFALFLLVLLGISALAIDYAGWLLTDRSLQNASDHSALAGASAFKDRQSQGSCSSGVGQTNCINARAQMWTSLNQDLRLGLSTITINCLASVGPSGGGLNPGDSPQAGELTSARASSGACTAEPAVTFGYRIWVTTPPPNYAAYTGKGGRFAQNFGVAYTRVDRDVRSLVGGALGIKPDPRAGWATAGALPIGFALQTFCRNQIAPQSGSCVNSAGLTIDGQGGIRLIRGDIGSNESLKVTANGGQGVQLQEGNMFLVNDTCGSSTWNCPNGSGSLGGISDGNPNFIGKNAFYMAPLPVPKFASPLGNTSTPLADTTIKAADCAGADAMHLCVPYKDQGVSNPGGPGSWTCFTTGSVDRCGTPSFLLNGDLKSCDGQGGGNPPLHYYAVGPSLGNGINPDAAHPQSNANKYKNIDDDFDLGDLDAAATPANPPLDYLYTDNISLNGSAPFTATFTVNLGQSGPRLAGTSTVRYVGFKTNAGVLDNAGNVVTLQVKLFGTGATAIAVDPTVRTLTDIPQRFEFTVGAGVIPTSQFNSLKLQFTFTSTGTNSPSSVRRGGGISWAEIQHPDPQPALPPMIPPGYYKSIAIPAGSCAVLDPTAEYSSLKPYQMPGIYRFGGTGNSNSRHIQVDSGGYLIGDGVTLVFDPDWPSAGSQSGLALDSSSALVLNTMRITGTAPCTPTETEATALNLSAPLSDLPYSTVCAAWGYDHRVAAGVKPGANAWGYCDPANIGNSHCVPRSTYNPVTEYRGITFYFTPDGNWTKTHASTTIQDRFQLQGDPGLYFRGVLYAPYDNAKITGRSGFNTVGQVLVWSAKFNGGSASIDLDFPYRPASAAPYLLEPTISR